MLAQKHLVSWRVEIQPLIFARNPSAFDTQSAFTLKAHRGAWAVLQKEKRPSYGNANREAETAQEEA